MQVSASEGFQQEADGYWSARDYPRVAGILARVQAAAAEEPNAEDRAKLADVIRRFVTPERLNILILDFIGGALDPAVATRFWDFCPDELIWPILLDTWARLPDGETRGIVLGALRRRMAMNMDLLSHSLAAPEAHRVRAARTLQAFVTSRGKS
jgi:hypothetical protein